MTEYFGPYIYRCSYITVSGTDSSPLSFFGSLRLCMLIDLASTRLRYTRGGGGGGGGIINVLYGKAACNVKV